MVNVPELIYMYRKVALISSMRSLSRTKSVCTGRHRLCSCITSAL